MTSEFETELENETETEFRLRIFRRKRVNQIDLGKLFDLIKSIVLLLLFIFYVIKIYHIECELEDLQKAME